MRCLLRILFNTLTVLSLLLCVATCVLWVRSYWVYEVLHHYDPNAGREYALYSTRGQCDAYRVWFAASPPELARPPQTRHIVRPGMTSMDVRVALIKSLRGTRAFGPRLGFALFLDWGSDDESYAAEVMFPHWAAASATALLPAYWVRRLR